MNDTVATPNLGDAGKHIARTNLFFFLNVLVQALRGFVLIPIFLRLMDPAVYGQWLLIMSWTNYALVVALAGLDLSIYQYVPPELHNGRGRAIYWAIVRLALVWATILYLLFAVAAICITNGDLLRIVLFGGLYIYGQMLWMLFLAPYRCEERTRIFLGAQISINLGDLIVTVVILLLFRSLNMVLAGIAIYHLTVAFVIYLVQKRRFDFDSAEKFPWRPYFVFGLSTTATQLITMGFYVMDKSVITYFAGLQALASYGPALSLGLVLLPLSAAGTITLPTLLVRSDVRDSAAVKSSILQSAIKQWGLLALPCGLGIALMAHFALTILASPKLAELGAPITWVAAAALLAEGMGRFANVALRAEHDIYWPAYIKVLHFVVCIAISVVAVSEKPNSAGLIVISIIMVTNISYAFFCFARLRRYLCPVLQPRVFVTPVLGCAGIVAWYVLAPVLNSVSNALVFVLVSITLYGFVVIVAERIGPVKLLRALLKVKQSVV